MKSVTPKAAGEGPSDPPDDASPLDGESRGRNAEVDFRGRRRTSETDASTTDPDARLCRKSPGVGAARCCTGHALMENRNGLIVDAELTRATGTAERVADPAMLEGAREEKCRVTLAADRACDTADFVMEARALDATPHVARNAAGYRAGGGRTTRHKGYAASQRLRKRIGEFFGWARAAAGLRKTGFRGVDRVRFAFTLAAAAYSLIRLPRAPRGMEREEPTGKAPTPPSPRREPEGSPNCTSRRGFSAAC